MTIGQAIKETRALLDQRRISIPQTPHYFSRAHDLRAWFERGAATTQMRISQALTHPDLTGMTRENFQALVDQIAVGYRAVIERRRHRQRGGQRRPGTRGGVFRQKITDADRILATVLDQRQLCDQQTLADLFGVSRGTVRNAINDVLPVLEQHGYATSPSPRRFTSAAEILACTTTTGDDKSPR